MRWWEDHVLPHVIDKALGGRDVQAYRAATCRGLEGTVLEVGFGSGLNVHHYPAGVTEVVAVEPSDTAWRLAGRRIDRAAVPVVRSGLDGQRLSEPDSSVDSVLLTFVLCTIPDQVAALEEARRVLRPGGKVHFVEHGLSAEPSVQRWQRRLEPLQRRIAGGCHLTRNPVEDLVAAGLRIIDVETFYAPGPACAKPLAHLYTGTAEKVA